MPTKSTSTMIPNWTYLVIGGLGVLLVGVLLGRLWPQRPTDPGVLTPPAVLEPTEPGSSPGSEGPGRACTMEAKICPDGSAVGRTGPNCEFTPCPGEGENKETSDSCVTKNLTIVSPISGQKAVFPLMVRGVVDNRSRSDCRWTVFEGQAASMTLRDAHDQVIGEGLLMAEGEWMTEGPIDVKGTITLNRNPLPGQNLTLLIKEDDPSGQTEPQKIEVKLTY